MIFRYNKRDRIAILNKLVNILEGIIVFHILNTLITVNVGDSRAILIKRVFNMKQSCSVFEAEVLNSAKTRLIMVMKRRRCIECGLKVKRFRVLQ